MRRFGALFFMLGVSVWAADFWQAKQYTEWSDKDVKKMLENSPWAKPVNVSGELVPPSTSGKRGGNGRGSMGEIGNPNQSVGDPMGDAVQSGVGRAAQDADPDRGAAPVLTFTVRWESALPVKQARVRAKYGSEAATSQEAKRALETEETNYVITVSGLQPNALRGDAAEVKKRAMAVAELIVKGRDPIKPVDLMLQRGSGAAIAVFAFPRTATLSLDDKEVEFSARFDSLLVKQKFQLKTMVFAGKLEL